jgi:predicted short-subunit dehydrogenase-like oxidoreductase (DUF2520 family)
MWFRRIGFIGAGSTGTGFAWHCVRLGYAFAGAYDCRTERARNLYRLVRVPFQRLKPSDVVAASDVVFFTTPDRDVTSAFCAGRKHIARRALVVHCAGAMGAGAFPGAVRLGLETLALHPIQTFASPAQAIRLLPGATFAVDGTRVGLAFGRTLARKLGGRCVRVAERDRPLYHAMCVFGSNFIAALLDCAVELGRCLGIPPARALTMLSPMARTAVEQTLEVGADRALTGPASRGDAATLARHLVALRRDAPGLLPIYVALSERLVAMARRRGLKPALDREMCRVLGRAR